jgi:hypothetical protein
MRSVIMRLWLARTACRFAGSGFGLAQLFFDAVEMLDLQQQPAGLLRGAFGGLVELAPRMRPARGEGDAPFAAIGEGGIGLIAVALHGALEVGGDDAVQTSRGSAGGPGEADVGSRAFAGPEVALFGLAVAGTQILDGRFVDLHVTSGHDSGVDVFINRAQPVGGQSEPACHALPWDGDVVPCGVDLLLPVERQMIAVLGDDDLREQSRCGDAALLQVLSGAMMGAWCGSSRFTYFLRMMRRRKNRAGW